MLKISNNSKSGYTLSKKLAFKFEKVDFFRIKAKTRGNYESFEVYELVLYLGFASKIEKVKIIPNEPINFNVELKHQKAIKEKIDILLFEATFKDSFENLPENLLNVIFKYKETLEF